MLNETRSSDLGLSNLKSISNIDMSAQVNSLWRILAAPNKATQLILLSKIRHGLLLVNHSSSQVCYTYHFLIID